MPSLFDDLKTKMTSLAGGMGATDDKLLSYSLADASTLLNEGFGKVKSAYGSIGPFSKMAADVPSFEKISAEISLAGGESLVSKGVDYSLIASGSKASLGGVGTSSATAAQIKEETKSQDADDGTGHKVKLIASTSDGESIAIQNSVNFPVEPLMERMVEFDTMPEVSEVRNIEYEPISAPQMPLEFQKYKGTKSTQWTINGTFICRTRDEAFRNFIYLNNLRGWSMPYFGEKQRVQFGDGGSRGKLGAPPPVLRFSGWRGLVGEVPVVITVLTWNWPKDCDWLPTGITDSEGHEIPFPTVMQVNIQLVESYAPNQVNAFDLVAFRNGQMVNAWLTEGQQPRSFGRAAEPIGANGGNQSVMNGTPTPTADEPKSTEGTKKSFSFGDTNLAKSLQNAWTGAKNIFTPKPDEAKTTPPIVATGDEGE